MRKIKHVASNIDLVDRITQEDIDKEPLYPCPICGDKGLTLGKRYWVISDPVLLCEEHGKDIKEIAMRGLKKLNSFKSKKELQTWRYSKDPKVQNEKAIFSAVIPFVNNTRGRGYGKVQKFAIKVAQKLWPWVMNE